MLPPPTFTYPVRHPFRPWSGGVVSGALTVVSAEVRENFGATVFCCPKRMATARNRRRKNPGSRLGRDITRHDRAASRRLNEAAMQRSDQLPGTRGDRRTGQERWRSRPAQLALGTVATLVVETAVEHYRPTLEMIMFVCGVGLLALLILVLVTVILFGSKERQDRAFRLLRWIGDKPEPPGPPEPSSSNRRSEALPRKPDGISRKPPRRRP